MTAACSRVVSRFISRTLTCVVSLLALGAVAPAQQITGVPGSPAATTTIPGDQLPAPAPPFGGKIERNAAQSTPYWPPRVVPPKDAPNILLIMTDDTGFGVSSTFGGVIPTPNLDRIAAIWEKLNQAARDVETFNLERKPLVFNVFGWLAEATRA